MSATSLVVIGGGPAGMMAAGTAAKRGIKTWLLDKNPVLGKKLRITGKGRCNLTAAVGLEELMAGIPGNGKFLRNVFQEFSSESTLHFFESLGVKIKIERGNRAFPQSDQAKEVAEALASWVQQQGVKILTGKVHTLTPLPSHGFEVQAAGGIRLQAEAVILATGGASYPLTGSTGDGYDLAQKMGHTLITPRPSLIALETLEPWVKNLSGLTLKNAGIKIYRKDSGKKAYEDFGELTFYAYGVGGPTILSASAAIRDFGLQPYELRIDLKPALDETQLDQRLQRDLVSKASQNFEVFLSGLLPRQMIPLFSSLCGIPETKKCSSITRQERRTLNETLKNLTLNLTRPRPLEEAIITSGGINVKEIDPKTMASKKIPGLFFAGEIIDCDGFTGGYNLQIAFSTGFCSGKHC